MPPLRRWVQFLGSAGAIVGLGVLFVKYGTPDDEQLIEQFSPEVKAQFLKGRDIRTKAGELLQKKMEQTRDNPAWLQGTGAMRKLDREIYEEARRIVEEQEQHRILEQERLRLKELADKERKL